jgi:hypothetical protein
MIKTPNEQASQLALKQRFLDRAKALSNLAEVARCPQVTLLICETVAFGVRAEAEIFQAAYGDPRGRKYWDAHLSEAIPVYSLAHVLSAHLAEKVEQLEMARIAIIRAFRDAAEAGERWFTGDTSSLLAMEYGQTNFENLGKLKVHPRAAVEWLLSKPKREHLVPPIPFAGFCNPARSPPLHHGPLPRKQLSPSLPATLRTSKRRAGVLPFLALKLLQRKLACAAVESISALPSINPLVLR